MTNSVNDAAALEVTVTENKMISTLTREQFEKIASDSDLWNIVSHEETGDSDDVTYCEMSIHNGSLGIKVSGIQFASDEDGDVEDGFTSEHKFDNVRVFDTKIRKRIRFPLNFGNADASDCDKGWFLDLIDSIVNDKINEAVGDYATSYDESDWTASPSCRTPVYAGSEITGYNFVIKVESVSGQIFGVTRTMMKDGAVWGRGPIICADPDYFSYVPYSEIFDTAPRYSLCVPDALANILGDVAEKCMKENLGDKDKSEYFVVMA